MARPRAARLLAILLFALHCAQVSGAAQCYGPDGSKVASAAPCNASATGTNGSHSACCNNEYGDACLESGLCYANWGPSPWQAFWGGVCTDPTGKDPSCFTPQCRQDMSGFAGFFLAQCNLYAYCCCGYTNNSVCNFQTCCANSFTLPNGPGHVLRVLDDNAQANGGSPVVSLPTFASQQAAVATAISSTSPATSTAAFSDTGSPSPACSEGESGYGARAQTAAVGGVLGSLLALCIAAAAFLGFKLRKLQRETSRGQTGPAELASYPGQGPTSSHGLTRRPTITTTRSNHSTRSQSAGSSRSKSEFPGSDVISPTEGYNSPISEVRTQQSAHTLIERRPDMSERYNPNMKEMLPPEMDTHRKPAELPVESWRGHADVKTEEQNVI